MGRIIDWIRDGSSQDKDGNEVILPGQSSSTGKSGKSRK